jgi:hypothetical protein
MASSIVARPFGLTGCRLPPIEQDPGNHDFEGNHDFGRIADLVGVRRTSSRIDGLAAVHG